MSTPTSTPTVAASHKHLNSQQILGIVLGALIATLLVLSAILFFVWRAHRKNEARRSANPFDSREAKGNYATLHDVDDPRQMARNDAEAAYRAANPPVRMNTGRSKGYSRFKDKMKEKRDKIKGKQPVR